MMHARVQGQYRSAIAPIPTINDKSVRRLVATKWRTMQPVFWPIEDVVEVYFHQKADNSFYSTNMIISSSLQHECAMTVVERKANHHVHFRRDMRLTTSSSLMNAPPNYDGGGRLTDENVFARNSSQPKSQS